MKHEDKAERNYPTAADYADPPPDTKWVIPDFLPQGISGIFCAPGDCGKSLLTIHWALAIASGQSILGLSKPQQGSVAIFAAEDDRDELHRRINPIAGELGIDLETHGDRIHLYPVKHSRLEPIFVEAMRGELASIDDLRLIVIDPLTRFAVGEPELRASDAADFYATVDELIKLPSNPTVLAVHRVAKVTARGSSALMDNARWVASLEPVPLADPVNLHGLNGRQRAERIRAAEDAVRERLDESLKEMKLSTLSVTKVNGMDKQPRIELYRTGYVFKRLAGGAADALTTARTGCAPDGGMWREFIQAWWSRFGPKPTRASELNELCKNEGLMLTIRGDDSVRSQESRLGRALLRAQDRVFGDLRLVAEKTIYRSCQYTLEHASEDQPDLVDAVEGQNEVTTCLTQPLVNTDISSDVDSILLERLTSEA